MKRILSYTLWAAAVMLLAACAKAEAPQPGSGCSAERLAITITDGGYAPAAGANAAAPATRAAERGYTTTFTAGDACGLYMVREGAVAIANLKVTASAGEDGSLVWTPDASAGTLYHAYGDRYFLYYPWQAEPRGAPAAGQAIDAADDAAFFAALIEGWTPAVDQSDYAAGYTASDLMTSVATAAPSVGGAVPLTFSMTHRMALAVVELPTTRYVFQNTNPAIPDYFIPTRTAFLSDAKPCRLEDHIYRYLVHPAASVPMLTGKYVNNGTREFSLTPAGMAAGSYKTYKVDGAEVTEKRHTLRIGDYLLSDGNLLEKDAAAETVRAAEVVGVVFQIDPARIGQAEKAAGCTHGLVVAAKASTGNFLWFFDQNGNWERDESGIGIPNIRDYNDHKATFLAADADIEGYKYNMAIREQRAADFQAGYYPAFKAAADFEMQVPAPAGTGWYLPSNGQWFDLLRNLAGVVLNTSDSFYNRGSGDFCWIDLGSVTDKMNAAFEHIAPEHKTAFGDTGYWTSSAGGWASARMVRSDNDSGWIYGEARTKRGDYNVRCVLAF